MTHHYDSPIDYTGFRGIDAGALPVRPSRDIAMVKYEHTAGWRVEMRVSSYVDRLPGVPW